MQAMGTHFIVRTCVDRLAGNGQHTIADEMGEVAVKGLHQVDVDDKAARLSSSSDTSASECFRPSANGILTVQLAPDQILAALSLDFADDLRASEIEDKVSEIERKVRAAHPQVVALFVKPQTGKSFRQAVRRRFGQPT
jgi:hypothetical protein